jgi:tRNA(fMet)-specific endonuclease VapC
MLLVDTNVVSYLFKGDTRGEDYQELIGDQVCAIAFITLAELYRWPLAREFGKAKERELEAFIETFVVLPYDHEMARIWARVSYGTKSKGVGISANDLLIAVTAIRFNLPLVTHNMAHFQGIEELRLITKS